MSIHGLKLSYAQWLTTPSSSVSLERAPEPWFSPEVRDARDPKVRWIHLDQVAPDVGEETSSTPLERTSPQKKSAPRPKDHRPNPEQDTSQEQDKTQDTSRDVPSDTSEAHEGTVGHYLDHIETVQQRDEARSARGETRSKRKRRSRRSSRGRAQNSSPDHSNVQSKDSPKGQSKTQTKTQSKRRRRRGRGKSKAAKP